MSEQWDFPSLGNKNIGYRFYSSGCNDLWDQYYRSTNSVSWHFGQFDTYGDGLTQHGRTYIVTGTGADCMASLAAHLSEHPELASDLYSFEDELAPLPKDLVLFLSKVNPTKDYYSVELRKTSGDHSKSHDKRWFRTCEYPMTESDKYGSAEMVWRLYTKTRDRRQFRGIEAFVRVAGIYEVLNETTYGHEDKRFEDYEFLSALRVLRETIAAVRGLYHAKRLIDCHKSNYNRKPEPATTEAVPAAAESEAA